MFIFYRETIFTKHVNTTSEIHVTVAINSSYSQTYTLKIMCKSKHFPRRYKRKRKRVFGVVHILYNALEGEGWSAICYMRYMREGGCFCWCYITLCIRIRFLGRPFKTLHSLEGLMIIDSIITEFFSSRFYRAMHFSAFARSCDRMSSVCPSVRPSVCPSCNVGDLWSHRLEILETNCTGN